jgi:hypothetical protein
MSDNHTENDSPAATLKSESARQRWELFHRAIAHAKQTTAAPLPEADVQSGSSQQSPPFLTLVK